MYILLVDDVPLIGRIIGQEIEALGRQLLQALDALDADELLRNHGDRIELILLDWNLPEMDGLQYLQRLKQSAKHKNIPVIMLTAEHERTNVVQAIKAGACDYLVKPFSRELLNERIKNALEAGGRNG